MKCGACTLCCELLPIKSLDKPANVMCKYCKNGCTIHGNHPLECSAFDCAYVQMDKVHEDLRPDNCKVIFEKMSDRVFFGTQHPSYELTMVARKQIKSFGEQGISTIIMTSINHEPMLFLAKDHTPEQVFKEWQEFIQRT